MTTEGSAYRAPACADKCRAVLVRGMVAEGIEVAPTWVAPLVPSPWEPLNLRCPHGVLWFMEPTAEGVAAMIAADARGDERAP